MGDVNIFLDEVGVLCSIVCIFIFFEIVIFYNIEKFIGYVKNGLNEYFGVKYVIRLDGMCIDFCYYKCVGVLQLEYGWKVECYLIDGDFIIFNCQFFFYKEFMMGYRVCVMFYFIFCLNLFVILFYNVDFDGDEMNLYVLQIEEICVEVKELCMVFFNIVFFQCNGLFMGIVQDILVGVYKFICCDIFFIKEQVMDVMMWVLDWDGVIFFFVIWKFRFWWIGKQIISMVIFSIINFVMGVDGEERDVLFKDEGFLIQ